MLVAHLMSITEAEVQQLAVDWYKKLDAHAPSEEYVPLLAEEGLEMRFPEATVYGFDSFRCWYDLITRVFFDEVHILKKVEPISTANDQLKVKVVVNWQASIWNPPAAKSERIFLDAHQTWVVKRSPKTQKPVISLYVIDSFVYAQGSYKL